ncbi:LacI family DNA-binding transcriptional regulator [Palleronia caenipelagi]|uniref:LacI family DNA-binding transcriptional regulator n=1 Tax=Palleronia caenipelagi TaxID=2489174 RepID=A0A547Q014_9RHOB|nr:LacI family DNA-binding transcriptional regulator [Palleronia caenipelagi]TRD19736.1 LacI family DNA-binding transcriptional regulator [Palleronia caenipelagi]
MLKKDEMPSIPTLEDVARASGVSTATVSRCLNAPDRVSEKTRKRVMKAVQDLGYAPNFGAQALAAKRTNTFGAVIPTIENAIFARGLQAFGEELHRAGVTLLVASSSYDPAREEEQIRALVARGADGLLLIGHDRHERCYDFLERRQIPHIAAWVYDSGCDRLAIGFDNREAMTALASEVIGLGHRRLGYITAEIVGNDRARARLEGVKAAMAEHGLDPDTLIVRGTEYSFQEGADAFAEIMAQPNPPTAVLCGNDVLAVGAVKQALNLGLRVPQDVSITGFDDISVADIVTPGLTTVHVPHWEMGARAAQMLLQLRNGEDRPDSVRLDTYIARRGSLGPPS